VALRGATDAELAEMQAEFDLHPLAVEDARHGHQRPKVEEYGTVAVFQDLYGNQWDLIQPHADLGPGIRTP